jgi:hypothetical protein
MGHEADKHHCEGCGADVHVVRANPLWRVAQVALFLFVVAMGFVASITALGAIFFGPYAIFVMMMAGPLNELASKEPHCPECRRIVPETKAAPVGRLRAAAAH